MNLPFSVFITQSMLGESIKNPTALQGCLWTLTKLVGSKLKTMFLNGIQS